MNKRIRVQDRYGRELEDEDEDGRIIVPDGGSVSVGMQFLDVRNGTYIRDWSREAYERYCDRLAGHKRKDAARNVRDAKPNRWQWYADWQIAHGNM